MKIKNQNRLKYIAVDAAFREISPYLTSNTVIGIGTGTTINLFIDKLAKIKNNFKGAVVSSNASMNRLKKNGIKVFDLNTVKNLTFYIDSADEINYELQMIKGGGAALTREKIISVCSKYFVCIVDESKLVKILGNFPLPVEIIPMAKSYVTKEFIKLGAIPIYRKGVITDNGNYIIDLHKFIINDAVYIENKINQLAGVVTNGIFANRKADLLFLGKNNGIKKI